MELQDVKRAKARLRVSLSVGMLLAPLALAAIAGTVSAACGPADVQVDGDACGSVLAVSVAGDASGRDCKGPVSCIAVSGTGNAENTDGDASYGYQNYAGCGNSGNSLAGCIAVSGTGSATNNAGTSSCGTSTGRVLLIPVNPRLLQVPYYSAGCVAVSATGDATNNAGGFSCGYNGAVGCIAVSGLGDATNNVGGPTWQGQSCGSGQFGDYVNIGCIAVSGAGTATNNARHYSCGTSFGGAGISAGCIAASGAGNAQNNVAGPYGGHFSCGNSAGFTVAAGCVAVSGLGSASNTGQSWTDQWSGETFGPCGQGWDPGDAGGIGLSCLAIGGGSASNEVDGAACETQVGAFGNSEAVRCVALSPASAQSPLGSPTPLVPATAGGWSFDRFAPIEPLLADGSNAVPEPAPWWAGWFEAMQAWFASTFGGVF